MNFQILMQLLITRKAGVQKRIGTGVLEALEALPGVDLEQILKMVLGYER